MANAALVIDNQADGGRLTASSQELAMPVSQIATAQPTDRWRSLSNSAYLVLDKGALLSADTAGLFGLTCGPNATIRTRFSSIDATGALGDVFDSGTLSSGDPRFDVNYASCILRLPAPAAWRYARFDLADPDASYVEAGGILDGLSETFKYNFAPGGPFQWNDRSRVEKCSGGNTLTWPDVKFRSTALSFGLIEGTQRYGAIERLDRVKGLTGNVLLMTDTASTNLPRDSLFGLMTELTPNAFLQGLSVNGQPLFSKQLKLEERV